MLHVSYMYWLQVLIGSFFCGTQLKTAICIRIKIISSVSVLAGSKGLHGHNIEH